SRCGNAKWRAPKRPPYRNSLSESEAEACLDGFRARLALESGDARKPLVDLVGICLQPFLCGCGAFHAVIQNLAHKLVLHIDGKDQILEEISCVRALRGPAR